ncbi:phage tail sheath family protein, partial [Saprospiraceae bacterium]|nr:phage tail sheath family protein [Saprospiraceae bacterium]
VDSFKEFINYFGRGPKVSFTIRAKEKTDYSLKLNPESQFHLYNSLRLFYANGGGACYIISVGDYSKGAKLKELQEGLELLIAEQEPSIVASPDAISLDPKECYELYRDILTHCGRETRDRFAIFDVPGGDQARSYDQKDVINGFRDGVGHNNLAYGAAYYPYLNTTVVSGNELSFKNVSNPNELVKLLVREAEIKYLGGVSSTPAKPAAKGAPKTAPTASKVDSRSQQKFDEVKKEIEKLKTNEGSSSVLDQNLKAISGTYNAILREIKEIANVMPTVGAIAGIYANVDNAVGVHKAPANIGLNSVLSPTVNVTGPVQEDLNLPVNGKAVNAIRSFMGKGILVWGARTLDGNSQDWKYINVRRTLLMIEQSVKSAVENYIFEPNTPQTWMRVRIAIENFLTSQWKRGALMGISPAEAYEVAIGLGDTMTPEDVLDGVMRISVFLSVSRPAEFIEITFEQRMLEPVDESAEEGEDEEGDDGGDEGAAEE